MFIQDALFLSNSRNEPWWFRLIRRTFALLFVGAVLFFAVIQIQNLSTYLNLPNIVIIESKKSPNYPGLIICPESVSPSFISNLNESMAIPEAVPQFSITCGRSFAIGPELLSENKTLADAACKIIPDKNGCLKFRPEVVSPLDGESINGDNYNDIEIQDQKIGFNKSFMFFNIKPNIEEGNKVELPSFYTIYFDNYQSYDRTFSIDQTNSTEDSINNYVEYNMFPITTGQRSILEYSVSIHRVYSTSLMGQLDTRPDIYSLEIKGETKTISRRQSTSQPLTETQFVIMPKVPHYMREEIEKYEYQTISIISNLGGFYGFIVTFYIFCFGMSKIEPWGVFQKTIFRCWPCRRSFKRHLAVKYLSDAGIPLGEDVDDRPRDARLEDRLQVLEYCLKDYFIDSYYLDELKMSKHRYDENDKHYKELETLVEARNRLIANRSRVDELNDDEYSRLEERKRRAKRWSNWSRKFGFSSRSTNNKNEYDIGATSANSAFTIPTPSPRKVRFSSLNFGSSDNDNHDEEIGTSSTTSKTPRESLPPPQRPFKFLDEVCRDSQDTLVEIKIEK